jgi:hypothetical protein
LKAIHLPQPNLLLNPRAATSQPCGTGTPPAMSPQQLKRKQLNLHAGKQNKQALEDTQQFARQLYLQASRA